jgi:hypothetical protein
MDFFTLLRTLHAHPYMSIFSRKILRYHEYDNHCCGGAASSPGASSTENAARAHARDGHATSANVWNAAARDDDRPWRTCTSSYTCPAASHRRHASWANPDDFGRLSPAKRASRSGHCPSRTRTSSAAHVWPTRRRVPTTQRWPSAFIWIPGRWRTAADANGPTTPLWKFKLGGAARTASSSGSSSSADAWRRHVGILWPAAAAAATCVHVFADAQPELCCHTTEAAASAELVSKCRQKARPSITQPTSGIVSEQGHGAI